MDENTHLYESLNPTSPIAQAFDLVHRSEGLMKQGDGARALDLLTRLEYTLTQAKSVKNSIQSHSRQHTELRTTFKRITVVEKLEAHIYNSMACVHLKQGNSYLALNYFRKSYRIIRSATNVDGIDTATLLLNIGILYSKLGNHDKAEQSSREAIQRILLIISNLPHDKTEKSEETMPSMFLTNVDTSDKTLNADDSKSIEAINLLYLAYYNCGIENDCMGYLERAIKLMELATNMHSFLAKACNSAESDAFSKASLNQLKTMQNKQAYKAFRKTQRIKPENPFFKKIPSLPIKREAKLTQNLTYRPQKEMEANSITFKTSNMQQRTKASLHILNMKLTPYRTKLPRIQLKVKPLSNCSMVCSSRRITNTSMLSPLQISTKHAKI